METFIEVGLRPEVLLALEEIGFEKPTEIQAKAIPILMESDNDLIGFAQTGTGKTAAFSLPILEKIDTNNPNVQAIILSPTRELGLQIAKDIEVFGKHIKKFKTTAVYGGIAIDGQIRALRANPQVVVGTPGRTLDLIKRRKLKLENVNFLVLDEADEMLSMGFKDDLDEILAVTPSEKQTLLFSATMPKDMMKLARKYMNNPTEITAGSKTKTTANVTHAFYVAQARDRYLALKRIVDVHPNIYGIIFCRTRQETKDVASKLMGDGYNSDALHGDLSQQQRDYVMERFRSKKIQLLIATDVAARGLDVDSLTHVINYNLPDDDEVYVHRSGRTGRADKKGTSVVIVHSRELNRIKYLEKKIGKSFERKLIPTGEQVCEKQLFKVIDTIEKVEVDEDQIGSYIPAVVERLSSLSHEDLIKRVVSVEFNRFLEYYKGARDINVDDKRGARKERGASDANFSRFFINLGGKDRLKPVELIGLINDCVNERGAEIGKIEILKSFSFFEIDSKFEGEVLESMNNATFENRKVSVEIAGAKPTPSGGDRGDRGGSGRGDRRRPSNRRRR